MSWNSLRWHYTEFLSLWWSVLLRACMDVHVCKIVTVFLPTDTNNQNIWQQNDNHWILSSYSILGQDQQFLVRTWSPGSETVYLTCSLQLRGNRNPGPWSLSSWDFRVKLLYLCFPVFYFHDLCFKLAFWVLLYLSLVFHFSPCVPYATSHSHPQSVSPVQFSCSPVINLQSGASTFHSPSPKQALITTSPSARCLGSLPNVLVLPALLLVFLCSWVSVIVLLPHQPFCFQLFNK